MNSPGRLVGLSALAACLVSAHLAAAAPAGDGERALLLVDPTDEVALYVANHYQAARSIPASNVLYMAPGAASYAQFAAENVAGFLGALANQRVERQVDFVVIPPGGPFQVPAAGFVSDSCFPVGRFSITAGYALARQSEAIQAGLASASKNHYARATWTAPAFHSALAYRNGVPSTALDAESYFVAALLGYTGALGNTLSEIIEMIDRSAATDATSPAGTVYYMQTSDILRSGPRHGTYPTAVLRMADAGGSAQHLMADLPLGQHDCLGIMTGLAEPDVDGADLTLLPGSFADHLTSFAGAFDFAVQTKVSRWIAKGASGSSGAVDEPCNYGQKFPAARLHVLYRTGLTLGEAWFRSMGFKPFQSLFYGDPLTRPYASPPLVDLPAPPPDPAAGTIVLAPTASATASGALVAALELYVDGRRLDVVGPSEAFALDTTRLADGWHELRIVAVDDLEVENRGRWLGALVVDNGGRAAALGATPLAGDLDQPFDFDYSTSGGAIAEVRLLHNGRVLAASGASSGVLRVFGRQIGAGPVRVQLEAEYAGGGSARSAPVDLDVTFATAGSGGPAPVAFGYAKTAFADRGFVVELPAAYADDPLSASYALVQLPAQADVVGGQGAYRILVPHPDASGTDALAFQVTTPSGSSSPATVTLRYEPPPIAAQLELLGCGINPPGSMQHLAGRPALGESVVLGLDNPFATQQAGALPVLALSLASDPNYPCGTQLAGFGMLGIGELLIGLGSQRVKPFLLGAPWSGPTVPAPIELAIPHDASLAGLVLFAQGLLFDPGNPFGFELGLTDAVEMTIGE